MVVLVQNYFMCDDLRSDSGGDTYRGTYERKGAMHMHPSPLIIAPAPHCISVVGICLHPWRPVFIGQAASKPPAPSKEAATAHFPSNLYLKQLVAGKDIALLTAESTPSQRSVFALAVQMKNFVYLVGDTATGEAVVIDGGWDVDGIEAVAHKDGMVISRFVATHYHWDHIGGPVKGSAMVVPGIKEWSEKGYEVSVPQWELDAAAAKVGLPATAIDPIDEGTAINIGDNFALNFLHTPGHSPGSVVIEVKQQQQQQQPTAHKGAETDSGSTVALITGDTVFPGSCGRLDLPESEPLKMWSSLQKVATLDPKLPIFPGTARTAHIRTPCVHACAATVTCSMPKASPPVSMPTATCTRGLYQPTRLPRFSAVPLNAVCMLRFLSANSPFFR